MSLDVLTPGSTYVAMAFSVQAYIYFQDRVSQGHIAQGSSLSERPGASSRERLQPGLCVLVIHGPENIYMLAQRMP